MSTLPTVDEIAKVSLFSNGKVLNGSEGAVGSITWIANDMGCHRVEARVTFRDRTIAISAPLDLDVIVEDESKE